MRKMSSCVLISFSPDAHEAGQDPVSTRKTVKCQEMGISLSERYQAAGVGLAPEAKLLIPYDRDYGGERELEYDGERWTVMNADPYKEYNGVILSIRRKKGNTAADDGSVPEPAQTAQEVGE
jgi:SPP1 family predicted phage head-tail adaptor